MPLYLVRVIWGLLGKTKLGHAWTSPPNVRCDPFLIIQPASVVTAHPIEYPLYSNWTTVVEPRWLP